MTIAAQVLTLLRQNGPMSFKAIHQSLAASATDGATVPSLNFLKTKVMHPLRKNNVIRAIPPSTLAQLQQQQQDGTAPDTAASKKHMSAKQLQQQNNKGTWHFVAVNKDGSKAKVQAQRKRVVMWDFPRYEDAVESETAVKA